METMERLYWNRCFICSSKLTQADQSGESSLNLQHHTSINSGLLPLKTLFQYLLLDSQDLKDGSTNERKSLLHDIIQLENQSVKNNGASSSSSTVKVGCCSYCSLLAEQVKSLHFELELVQMKLIDKLKTVKQCVLSNSRLYGSNDALKLQFQKFEDQLEQQASAGEQCENERFFLDVLHRFQTFIFESDIQVRNIPLVYLNRNMSGGTVPLPSPQDETAGTSIVKQELVDDNDYENEFESQELEDTSYCHNPDSQFEAEDEWLYPSRTITMSMSPPTRRNREAKTNTKPATMTRLPIKQAELPTTDTENKATKKPHLTVPVESSSSLPVSKNEEPASPTEAQKLAKAISLKKKANSKGMTKSEKQVMFCEECPYESNRPSRMEQHYREHEGTEDERNLECPDCKKKFKHNQYLEFHITHYCGMRNWKCDVCSEYVYRPNIKEHVDEHHEGKLYHCEQCDYMFASFLHLVAHKRYHVHGDDPQHECVECPEPKTFQSKINLLRHLHEDHGHTELVMKCTYENCLATFYFKTSLNNHLNVHTGKFTCEVCNKAFGSPNFLERHIRLLHTKEKPFHCDHCEERFTSKPSLDGHMRLIHNVFKHKCEICSKAFSERGLLKHHKAKNHGIGEVQQCSCNICGKSFSHRKTLNAHKITHIDKKNFTCDICGYATKTKGQLQRHMAKHGGEKNYVCSYCSKSFARKEYLQDHLRTHTLERPFQCEICGTSFQHRRALHHHKRRHLDDKPFVPKGPRPRSKKNVDDNLCEDPNQNSNEVQCS